NGVKQYNIQVASDANFNSVIGSFTATDNSYDFSSFADGNYFIRIQAEDYTGNKGDWSNVENLLIDNNAPTKPANVTGKVSLDSITVNWSPASDSGSGLKEYKIEFSTSSTFSSITHSATLSGTSYTASDLADGTYYFRVSAVDNVNNVSAWSTVSSVIVDTTAPQAASNVKATQNSGIVTLSWDAASDAGVGVKEYIVEYSTDNSFSSIAGTRTVSGTSCSINGLADGNYCFRVRAVDKNGNAALWSNTATVIVDSVPPAKPTATADITAETEDAVTITATFSKDSVVKQYSLDNKTWQTYTDGVVMESNGFVYFRSFDAAGNVSQTAVYEVNNIIAVPDVIDDDLDNNGLADVVLVHTKQGYSGAWLTTGTTSVIKWGSLSNVNAGTEILGTGTLYGSENDGQDIFFADSKSVGAWNVVDGKVTGYKSVMSINSTTNVLGLGDFNGDGATDILLRSTNGDLGYYNTDGTGFTYLKGLGKEWTVAAIGDLNGDGLDDTVLRHDAGFAGTFLTQENGTVKWASLDTLKSDMTIVGTGDFNGDGVDDVLLQNKSNGWVGAWLVEDGRVDSFIGLCNNKNTIEQIADFNGDGIDDLRIRAGADIGVLYVNGADDTTWQYFKSVGTEWDTSFSALA
ncbi:MAG: fibronectin type III domain-containing protein, partial [Lentisphaeria bacterium]|nr:fibronectin type III domain-containing protein [Lentisphaeria bacterium]